MMVSQGEAIIRHITNVLLNEEKLRPVKGICCKSRTNGEIVRNEKEILAAALGWISSLTLGLYDIEKYYPPVEIRGKMPLIHACSLLLFF